MSVKFSLSQCPFLRIDSGGVKLSHPVGVPGSLMLEKVLDTADIGRNACERHLVSLRCCATSPVLPPRTCGRLNAKSFPLTARSLAPMLYD